MRRASMLLLLVACETTPNATSTNDAGSPASPDASEPSTDAATDASFDATADADASAAADADADADAGWTHFEFPEQAYPNGWLVATQGTSPNNWGAATIASASSLNVFTNDPTGGGACSGQAQCAASQCVASVCRQRVKQKSPATTFGYGRYQWRVYVAPFVPADAQASVGAFIYADDTHELDFECGPGKNAARASGALKHLDGSTGAAAANEMLCYATSQANPFVSTPTAVPVATWHVFEIRLEQGSGGYLAKWLVDDVVVESEQLAYGPTAASFAAFVSVENLSFIGETYPTGRNDAYFDWFRHRPQ
jgi:hypothetical protein